MQEARKHQRVSFRLPVNLLRSSEQSILCCHTRDLGCGGLYAVGAREIAPGETVRLEILHSEGDSLKLDGQLAWYGMDGAGISFSGNSTARLDNLRSLLTPDWDGEDLLDGVVKMAPWFGGSGLAGWMRLTSLVSDWQRLTNATDSDRS